MPCWDSLPLSFSCHQSLPTPLVLKSLRHLLPEAQTNVKMVLKSAVKKTVVFTQQKRVDFPYIKTLYIILPHRGAAAFIGRLCLFQRVLCSWCLGKKDVKWLNFEIRYVNSGEETQYFNLNEWGIRNILITRPLPVHMWSLVLAGCSAALELLMPG